jgi:hypothetical protein
VEDEVAWNARMLLRLAIMLVSLSSLFYGEGSAAFFQTFLSSSHEGKTWAPGPQAFMPVCPNCMELERGGHRSSGAGFSGKIREFHAPPSAGKSGNIRFFS